MNKLFITFEGPEGSGKTSVINGIKSFFDEQDIKYITTREPGGNKIAEDIRKIILDKENKAMDPHAEALLFAASRSLHFHEVVKPALDQNKVVLCDRFIDSSLAYQGYARNLGIEEVYAINTFAIGDALPDLTIFIDVPPKVGLDRVFSNTRKVDRLDLETIDFHEKVYQGYMEIHKRYPSRFKIVDGTNNIEQVINDTLDIIKNYIK